MGCKCRQTKKIGDMLTNTIAKPNLITRIIAGALLVSISLVVVPFFLLYLYISFIIKGDLLVRIPNFLPKKDE